MYVWVRVEQALELVCIRLPLRPQEAGRPGHGELVGARPAGARGRQGVGGGTAVTVFSNGPEPRVPKDCLTVRVGLEVDLRRPCFPTVARPASRGTASVL